MPNAKRLKGSVAEPRRPKQAEPLAGGGDSAPADVKNGDEDEHDFVPLARKNWLKPGKKPAKPKVKNDVIKQGIWDVLERDGFQHRTLLLENLQALESYLWPGYTDSSSNYHVLLMALIINVKRREHLDTWSEHYLFPPPLRQPQRLRAREDNTDKRFKGIFEKKTDEFSSMFRRVLSLTLDRTLSSALRAQLVSFLIHAFQSLDHAIVRKECAPLVSIGIWQNLSSEKQRDSHLDRAPHLRKAWRASLKRFDAADDATKARLRFDRSWIYSLLLDFMSLLNEPESQPDAILYCERFTELITDLQSQLPTRRYVNALLQDLHLLPVMRLSPLFNDESNALLRDLYGLLCHYTHFTVDDQSGLQLSRDQAYDAHCVTLGKLQRVALTHFKPQLTVLALSNYGAIDKRDELLALLEQLSDDDMRRLIDLLDMRSSYPESLKLPVDRKLLNEIMVSKFERQKTFQDLTAAMALLPTEKSLFDSGFRRANEYDGSRPLALPKMNLQYLSAGDFLWRALVLYRCESFYGIRKDIEAVLKRLQPEFREQGAVTHFAGFSKMALPISKPAILEVVPARIGQHQPSLVKAEVFVEMQHLNDSLRREWLSLGPDDVVFLLNVAPSAPSSESHGGESEPENVQLGVLSVRTAEIMQMTDDKRQPQRDGNARPDHKRRILLKLDAHAYVKDSERTAAGKPDVYGGMNVLLRRNRRENNFKPVLESIRSLVMAETPLPPWLHDVFLGYGDPTGATYKNLGNRITKLDYRDTFLDWQHLVDSLSGLTVEPEDKTKGTFGPPYILEEEAVAGAGEETQASKPSKKRRRDADPPSKTETEVFRVSTYTPPNNGPYPSDAPRTNRVRFTPTQVEAIVSGSQPGLTVIVGPPGTGKTDVATQIISNIYHNFPKQRTLLIAHSNQALNQLFTKIVALDIDERHLLRLGRGEEELDTQESFGNHGRVESRMHRRVWLLQEVKKLAVSLGAPGAHDNSAETAGYFNTVYVEPAWARFLHATKSDTLSGSDLVREFPFHAYFADAPQPLFPPEADREQLLEIARGCHRHLSRIFSELADIFPFEVLRRDRDKANYLLTREARIVAMTTTHAAIRRAEISALGFRYDNVVMEEAAQITEVETFLPLAMQLPVKGVMPLQRLVLCGDHFQNSPVIQNLAFRHYANLEQSLFSRLVRLGVPVITLDQQGRARASIAKLYAWRYPKLGNLDHVQVQDEFQRANAGFKFDYQFIHVPDYKGRGEAEPTPHFLQNLGEAEYAVALFQYMRLLGYPAEKISILTTYAGQRALIKDVLSHRCARNPLFGLPKAVATVDKYQGEQNDYIILSLTRTTRVGYLRDVRRLTVAVSRARLGLYVLGRRQVFESCPELQPAFDLLLARPDKLMLVTGELWPTSRSNNEKESATVEGEAVMEGVEHLGQYVFEMTQTRMNQLQVGQGAEVAVNSSGNVADAEKEDEADEHGEDGDDYEDERIAKEPDIADVSEGAMAEA